MSIMRVSSTGKRSPLQATVSRAHLPARARLSRSRTGNHLSAVAQEHPRVSESRPCHKTRQPVGMRVAELPFAARLPPTPCPESASGSPALCGAACLVVFLLNSSKRDPTEGGFENQRWRAGCQAVKVRGRAYEHHDGNQNQVWMWQCPLIPRGTGQRSRALAGHLHELRRGRHGESQRLYRAETAVGHRTAADAVQTLHVVGSTKRCARSPW